MSPRRASVPAATEQRPSQLAHKARAGGQEQVPDLLHLDDGERLEGPGGRRRSRVICVFCVIETQQDAIRSSDQIACKSIW